jgi:CRP/FNR family transcriptional regulator, nitrogen oxide reductase regulator
LRQSKQTRRDRLRAMNAPLPRSQRLFEGFSPQERDEILSLGTPQVFRRGEILFREREPATTLYLPESGRIKLTQLSAEGEEVIMRYMAPGEVFAAVALFPGGTYPVTAEATERSRVRTWTGEALHTLVRQHPRFEANLLRIVSAHTQEALSRVRELATENVAQRLARTLLRLGSQIGQSEPDGAVLVDRITQQEIAQISGTTLYTVSRTLTEWQEQGIVDTGRQRYRIVDPGRLGGLAEGG